MEESEKQAQSKKASTLSDGKRNGFGLLDAKSGISLAKVVPAALSKLDEEFLGIRP